VSDKPVYIAGQGFQSTATEPPRRRGRYLAWVLALLAVLLIGWRLLPDRGHVRLEVRSVPSGAEILVDLAATGLRTPATLDLPVDQTVLVQARLAGLEASPTSVRLTPAELRRARALDFSLRPLPPGHPAVAGAAPPPLAPPVEKEAVPAGLGVGISGLLEGTLATPAPPERGDGLEGGFLEIGWLRWDPAFRLKVDGQALPVSGARALPAGTHRLQVELGTRQLLDTLLGGSGPRLLALPPRDRFVEIQVTPDEAEIVAGDRALGLGRCLLLRADLPLLVSFPPLPGRLPPAPLLVKPDAPASLHLSHRPPVAMEWSGSSEGGLRQTRGGYVLPGEAFHEDDSHQPRREGSCLLLGRAFHDRRPGGSQAAIFEFDLPAEINPAWQAELALTAEDSGQRYPLILSRGASLSLLLNGTALARGLALEPGAVRRAWPVSNLLKPGRNVLQVQSGEASRSAARLCLVEVRIGP
jgi:hypothetical protein